MASTQDHEFENPFRRAIRTYRITGETLPRATAGDARVSPIQPVFDSDAAAAYRQGGEDALALVKRIMESARAKGGFVDELDVTPEAIRAKSVTPFGNWGSRDAAERAQRAIAAALRKDIEEKLDGIIDRENLLHGSMSTRLDAFKGLVERQMSSAFYGTNGRPLEEFGRSLLQAFLFELRTYREVSVGRGRSDLLALSNDGGRFVFEVKIWNGPRTYASGVSQLQMYAKGEGDDGQLGGSYLVIFDPTRTTAASRYIKASEAIDGISVVVIDICRHR